MMLILLCREVIYLDSLLDRCMAEVIIHDDAISLAQITRQGVQGSRAYIYL
jgi:hypothetical protein